MITLAMSRSAAESRLCLGPAWDIATSALDMDVSERERLHVLAELDSLAVASRSSLGRHVIAMLEE